MYLIKIPKTGNPALHLATEEFALRTLDAHSEFLFVYENEPCVMLGKNQNPFEEVNLVYLKERNIPLYRRMSGGGTVFHGHGNINFTIITGRQSNRVNNYAYFLTPVVAYLNSIGVPARMNERNDLLIGENKISGNAQFTSRDRMFSHGTLLFNSELKHLREALKAANVHIESRCTSSKPSPVQNIFSALKTKISMQEFRTGLVSHLLTHFGDQGVYPIHESAWTEIQNLAEEKYSTDDWNLGRTPRFSLYSSFRGKRCIVQVKNGRIEDINLEEKHSLFDDIFLDLRNVFYRRADIQNLINKRFANYPRKDYHPVELVQSIYPFMEL